MRSEAPRQEPNRDSRRPRSEADSLRRIFPWAPELYSNHDQRVRAIDSRTQITGLLVDLRNGDPSARERLWPLVYEELRHLAQAYLRDQRRGHTLQATALVHEAFVKLVDIEIVGRSRGEFLGLAAKAMRSILVDHARGKGRAKRGADAARVTLEESAALSPEPPIDLLDLDRALDEFAHQDARKAQAIELIYFGGLTLEQAAEVLDVSVSTLRSDVRLGKAWLLRRLSVR